MEFIHNRITLDRVRRRLHGSKLEGSVIYCDLVSDLIRTYDDTHSRVLYLITDSNDHHQFITPLMQGAATFNLVCDLYLHRLRLL